MNVTLPQLAGDQLVGFLLVMCRVGGLFALAPVFSARMIPTRVKLMAAGAISVAFTPLVTKGIKVPTDPPLVAELMLKEIVVGLAFALVIAAIGAGIQAGASLVDSLIGFSFGAMVDPITNMNNAVLGQVYALFSAMVFITTGGDQLMVMGLSRSYDAVPLDGFPDPARLADGSVGALATVLVIALEIAAPAVIALLVSDAALGLVARTVPQMNVFVVGLPAKILLGFATIAASLPFVSQHIAGDLQDSVYAALRMLGGG